MAKDVILTHNGKSIYSTRSLFPDKVNAHLFTTDKDGVDGEDVFVFDVQGMDGYSPLFDETPDGGEKIKDIIRKAIDEQRLFFPVEGRTNVVYLRTYTTEQFTAFSEGEGDENDTYVFGIASEDLMAYVSEMNKRRAAINSRSIKPLTYEEYLKRWTWDSAYFVAKWAKEQGKRICCDGKQIP